MNIIVVVAFSSTVSLGASMVMILLSKNALRLFQQNEPIHIQLAHL